ncbi:MAG: hypothetical protein HY741_10840 [Chloroflexi bacterium]|nr:hypothetical protein [Chloroflexota bacterium]
MTIDQLSLKQLKNGNDHVVGDLRADAIVNQAKDYTSEILAGGKPSSVPNLSSYTAGWLGINLAENDQTPAPNGKIYPWRFTQVGLQTNAKGVRWFVYSEQGHYQATQCLRGSDEQWPGLGCSGNYNDLVALGRWTKVELVTYMNQGFWIARIYDQNGRAYDVAKIFHPSLQVFRVQVTTEEAYAGVSGPDPHIYAEFYHNRPQYMVWGTGFQDWPASAGGNVNNLWTFPPGICPDLYGANIYAPRYWAGLSSNFAHCVINPLF